MTEAQQRLLDKIEGKGQVPVRGSDLRVARSLERRGRVVMSVCGHGGYSAFVEHVDDFQRRLVDDFNAEEAAREAAQIGSAEEAA